MPVTTFTSRQFNQDAGRAKKATKAGPVIITDRGEPAHVLLSIADYRKLTGSQMTLVAALAQVDAPDIDFEVPRLKTIYRAADLS